MNSSTWNSVWVIWRVALPLHLRLHRWHGDIPDAASEAANVCQCMDFPRFIRHRKHRQTPQFLPVFFGSTGRMKNVYGKMKPSVPQQGWAKSTGPILHLYIFFPWEWRQETCKPQRELGTPANWKNYSMNNSFPLSRWRCWRIRFQVVKG